MEKTRVQEFIDKVGPKAESGKRIPPDKYHLYDAKRGLRNEDGTGVLVGLTEIGEVHGYYVDDREKMADEGRLIYRGYNLRDIVEGFQAERRFGFEEVCYLLLVGHLPSSAELEEFRSILAESRRLPAGFVEDVMLRFPSSDIMNKLARTTLVCYSFDEAPEDHSFANVLRQSMELVARFPIFAAYGYQAKQHYHAGDSLYIHSAEPELSAAENLLQMIRPDRTYTQLEAEVLDLCLVLHAEHGGGNNSAFAVHVVSSAATDTYSAISTAVGSLKGAKHGGANAKVMGMMETIKSEVSNWEDEAELAEFLRKLLRGEAHDGSGLIYGMGHAVYTLSDPRAVIIKGKAEELAVEKEFLDEYNLYKLVEKLTPQVFSEHKGREMQISPNVDFYSGFVYKMLNIPMELYTPIFAVARVPGWCAHRLEELVSGGKIIRPAYKSIAGRKRYVPMGDRG